MLAAWPARRRRTIQARRGRPVAAPRRAGRPAPPRSSGVGAAAELGDRVHQRADALRRAGAAGPPTVSPAASAARSVRSDSTFDGETRTGSSGRRPAARSSDSRRSPHQPSGSAPGHAGGGQPGQLLGRGPAASRRAGSAVGRPRRAAARRPAPAGQRARHRRDGADPLGQAGGVELVEEPGRAGRSSLAGHRGDEQPVAGPGGGDVEQPALLVEQLGASGRRRRRPGAPVGAARSTRSLRAEQGAAQPQVGPEPSCTPATATTSHSRPLAACAVSTRTASPSGARSAPACRPGSAGPQVVEEDLRPAPGQPVDEPGRGVEQRHHRVQVAVGRLAARHRRRRLGPLHRSASPLACQTAQSTSSAVPRRPHGRGRADGRSSPATRGGRCGRRAASETSTQLARVAQRLDEQRPGRAGRPRRRARPRRSSCRSRRSASTSAPPSGE